MLAFGCLRRLLFEKCDASTKRIAKRVWSMDYDDQTKSLASSRFGGRIDSRPGHTHGYNPGTPAMRFAFAALTNLVNTSRFIHVSRLEFET